ECAGLPSFRASHLPMTAANQHPLTNTPRTSYHQLRTHSVVVSRRESSSERPVEPSSALLVCHLQQRFPTKSNITRMYTQAHHTLYHSTSFGRSRLLLIFPRQNTATMS